MKPRIFLLLLFFALLLLLPLWAGGGGDARAAQGPQESAAPAAEPEPGPEAEPETAAGEERVFRILDEGTGEIFEVADRDFLAGAVAAEMPPAWPEEALKAQAVAAYTYYSRLRAQQEDPAAAHFSADPANWRVYVSREQMAERFGAQAPALLEKLDRVVSAVEGQTLQYEGELALAVYHAISGGKTEASADIWGGAVDYLVPVDSPGDPEADGYETVRELDAGQVRRALEARWPGIALGKDPGGWFSGWERSGSGSVLRVQAGGQELEGGALRTALGLRSANFTADYRDGRFTFTVRGYGHGVGMSQTGAAAMARDGATYEEILAHYYPNTELAR